MLSYTPTILTIIICITELAQVTVITTVRVFLAGLETSCSVLPADLPITAVRARYAGDYGRKC